MLLFCRGIEYVARRKSEMIHYSTARRRHALRMQVMKKRSVMEAGAASRATAKAGAQHVYVMRLYVNRSGARTNTLRTQPRVLRTICADERASARYRLRRAGASRYAGISLATRRRDSAPTRWYERSREVDDGDTFIRERLRVMPSAARIAFESVACLSVTRYAMLRAASLR